MEKIKSICVMRELFKALSELETRLMEQYGVSLNEAMALCCIGGDTLTASVDIGKHRSVCFAYL